MAAEKNPPTLASKMVKILSETKRIAKNGRNEFHKYDYVTEADVLEAVRDVLVKHNVFIYTSVMGTDKNADMTSVVMEHTIVDADTNEKQVVKSFGQGQDKGDKGGPKAITSANKYFLLKTFLLPTGDDPEASDESGKSTAPKNLKVATSTDISRPTLTVDKAPPKKFGFSGKSKPATPGEQTGMAAVAVSTEGADEF